MMLIQQHTDPARPQQLGRACSCCWCRCWSCCAARPGMQFKLITSKLNTSVDYA